MIDARSEADIRRHRLRRVRERLRLADCAAIALFDPVHIRYATGTRNMQVWTMHNRCRYAVIFADAATVLFDATGASHLAAGLVDDVRPALSTDYMAVGPRVAEMGKRWAAAMISLLREKGIAENRLAIDRADLCLTLASQAAGLELIDGQRIMERARAIKSAAEIRALQASLETCEASVAEMRARLEPGMRESDALAMLVEGSLRRGGEYPETRLLTSGPRTNPWFQETADRVIDDGDLLSFDTDLIGPMGFYNDISRSWVVGERRPTDRQRRLYALAHAQLEHNLALLRPGVGFLEYADRAYRLPDEYIANRYADVAHGCGLGVEYPFVWYREDAQWGAHDGEFEADMVVCVEAYAGEVGGREGVKLEQPVWITERGPMTLSAYPLEVDYL